ncbi:hypothetical protein B296_00026791 [Ensete ventricosum]|uniref:Uncharacterized protein n=1 Tax=Ensete ventricosum TaxID=4639 RepID=A0A427ADM5_ENSVE|nr:hypothetical protein B296_00026791 [Ensete ventricosum]
MEVSIFIAILNWGCGCCFRSMQIACLDLRRMFYIKRLPLLFTHLIGNKCFSKRKVLLFDDYTSSSEVSFFRCAIETEKPLLLLL